ncbi:hypothetical protein [Salinicola halophilus]|uniref:hypothetical protein n=1 Tax=Salinicola halophilus TaxID=184065 RepID=UPI0019551963|nr:hypothetical protein [Salinicola halophilus]
MKSLEQLGRVRLSRHFFMRDFLHSEISQMKAVPNVPDYPDRAIEAGRSLCEELLEPLQERFGRIAIRSAYRSPTINAIGAENGNQFSCASNDANNGHHIWDYPDAQGHAGATACIVVPALLERYEACGDWTPLAWWIHDNLPYTSQVWFPTLAAFNLRWSANPDRRPTIRTYVTNPHTGNKRALVDKGVESMSRDQRDPIVEAWLDSL